MMGVYPPGSTVQLTDDRYALVVAVNSSRPLKLNVLVHDAGDAARGRAGARPRERGGLGIRRSVRAQPAAADRARLPRAERARHLFLRAVAGGRTTRSEQPLPVDPFSVAEAARRTWPALIEAMLEAVCLVEPEGLRIVAANGAGRPPARRAAVRAGRPRHAGDARRRRRTRRSGSASPTRAAAPASSPIRTSPAPAARRCRWCAGSAGSSRRRATRSTCVALLDRSEQIAGRRQRRGRHRRSWRRRSSRSPTASWSSTWPATSATSTAASRRSGAARRDAAAARRRRGASTGCASASPTPASTCAGWPRSTPTTMLRATDTLRAALGRCARARRRCRS